MADVLTIQVGGTHYKDYKYQPIEFFMDLNLSPAIHSAIKYLTRIGTDKDKGGVGIDKSIHYIQIFEAYWKDKIYFSVNYPIDFLGKLVEFTKQFPPKIGEIIKKIVLLGMGVDWTAPALHKAGVQSPISKLLRANCQVIIKELNTLKENYYANQTESI